MMRDSNKLSTSDDEEDLEALRLAALQSLKKKNAASNGAPQAYNSAHFHLEKPVRYNRSMKGMHNKRGRFFGSHFGPHQAHNGKKGLFINRVRNMNLISIPTIPTEENIQESKPSDSELVFNLPQDRYCGVDKKEVRTEEGTSKFNRYDNSDKSETESEEEEEVSSEDASPAKLERSDSLEALMQELDDEIQGKTKTKEGKPPKEEKVKIKKTKKKKRMSSETAGTSDSDAKVTDQKLDKVESENKVEVINHNETDKSRSVTKPVSDVTQTEEKKAEESAIEKKGTLEDTYSPAIKRPRSKSPVNRRGFQNRRRQRNFRKNPRPLSNIPFPPPPTQYSGPVMPFPNQPFNPLFAPPNIGMLSQPPPFFERPLSPLAINTESLTTATLAPLSPRSAAFVLENKAIIERRKRSPRRSYSRSPSRSPRRSLSPRRSPRRSMSPRRISRSPRRLSRSPRRRSLSPRRRSVSPRRKNIGRSTDNSPKNKQPVRERLGLKPNKTEENRDKSKEVETNTKKDEKSIDPVLEARKRKFETKEIKMKEGIIRLKPKEDKPQESMVPPPVSEGETKSKGSKPATTTVPEEKSSPIKEETPTELDEFKELEDLLKEDILLESDDIDLDPKVDDLFSDEDSASDNEGRFKVKQQTDGKPPVLSFTKLVNGSRGEIKSEALRNAKKSSYDRRRDRHSSTKYDKRRSRGRSPTDRKDVKGNIKEEGDKKSTTKKLESQEKSPIKNRISLKSDRHVTPMEKRFERKIEIKIKNPSKYERGGKLKFSKDSDDKTSEKVSRKVEVGNKGELMEKREPDVEPEIVVENDSGDEENSIKNEGDLRAQLSKKRAEKLHRIPVEGVSSRLLQNALQGAVFKKTKKKVKDQDITSSDGKLPIHLRLGIANSSDIFTDTKVKRKTRKRKNREVLEQVYYLLLRHYYISQF